MTRKTVIAAAGLVAVSLWALLRATAPGGQPPVFLIRGTCGAAAVPVTGPDAKNTGVAPVSAAPCVNVNSAGLQQLTGLPGIGEALAGRIIERRNRIGAFARIDDMLEVKGLGPARLKKIHDLVCF